VKAHVEQLSDLKGAKLAAEFGAISVDHIEYLDPKDIPVLQKSGTVAVLLPGAFYYLSETQKPPVAALRANQVPMAIATDLNPGSSPIASILTIMNMASVLFGLTPEEVLYGVTLHAAKALNLSNKGQVKTGMDADLCLWDIAHPAELVYGINQHRPSAKWFAGKEC
jgi:imidazolonepropionase